MRILYVAMKYDYGKPEQGYSFEHYNFYHSLYHMGHDILYFDFMTLMQVHGKEWMNRRLLDVINVEKPDLMFTVLFTDELDKTNVRNISENTDTITLNWFCDDHWRFDNFSRDWAPCFNWSVTTSKSALPKYEKIGYKTIKSQWACNPFLYRKMDLPLKYDLTFVGQPHGDRREVVQALRNGGLDVRTWGSGWEAGRISQEDMIRIFNQSRVNLNLSNASIYSQCSKKIDKFCGIISEPLSRFPFSKKIKGIGRKCISVMNRKADTGCIQPFDQIKGRNFEIPGCGGFTMTGNAENLEEYYKLGTEVVCFEDRQDLLDKVRYYLDHEEERTAIAWAGYERTMKEHTYVHRLDKIFRRIGLPSESVNKILKGEVTPGNTVEVH